MALRRNHKRVGRPGIEQRRIGGGPTPPKIRRRPVPERPIPGRPVPGIERIKIGGGPTPPSEGGRFRGLQARLGRRRGMGMLGYGQAGFQRMGAAGRRRRIG